MTVENMVSTRGNRIPNQFVLRDEKHDLVTFQSYKSIIAEVFTKGAMGFRKIVHLYPDWNYSNTTRKYLYKFFKDLNIDIKNSQDVKDALQRGYVRTQEDIAIVEESKPYRV